MIPLLRPGLYAEQGTPALPDAPALRAVRSRSGHVSFPPQRYGCQVSGEYGEDLQDVLLTGRGRLHAIATVHIHPKPLPATPFTVVEVAMDDGPLVRGLLSASHALPLAPGAVLVTRLEEIPDESGGTVRDLRFVAAASPSPKD
ncbi:hypothetical protein [Hydrogenophaga sp. OTU3427]|uniref:hypothetical protein n=1 Tax=Hydrogenophaga sp. OTU3427 TaxID=3043856 RepID=UPI00313C7B7B